MHNLDYRIGFDIGSNSVGWAVIELNYNDEEKRYEPKKLINEGVHIFDRAEDPKSGSSLAEPRRIARSTRRRLKRKKLRKQQIRQLLIKYSIITEEELTNMYPLPPGSVDVWDLRVDALERILSAHEWARLLIHLAQKRGYQSNRKTESSEKKSGEVLSAIAENDARLSAYRTVGEFWVRDEKFANLGRRHNTIDTYEFHVSRKSLEDEIRTIFAIQRELGSLYASKELEDEYIAIWGHQLPFASGDDIFKKVGFCNLEKDKRRIPKATYSFQYFFVLDKINNLKIGSECRKLEKEERDKIIFKIFQDPMFIKRKNGEVSYSDLRKWLDLDESTLFSQCTYDPNKSLKENEKRIFANVKPFFEIKKALASYEANTNTALLPIDLDTFGFALTMYKTDKDIKSYLSNTNNLSKTAYSDELINLLLDLSFSGFGNLSREAINKILPIMETGLCYAEAVTQAGYDSSNLKNSKKEKFLPVIPNEITNPVVRRSLSVARKILNKVIKTYGSPIAVHIELARELTHDADERKKITRKQEENRNRNLGAISVLRENGIIDIKGFDIVRYKLWKEQDEKCAYSLKHIPAEVFFAELRKEKYAEPTLDVDHILPYSRTFMDGYDNKVLVYSDENRKKGNKTPYEYLSSIPGRWEEFEKFVVSNRNFSSQKRSNLLRKSLTDRESQLLKDRHLIDTRYASKFFKEFIDQNLQFKETQNNMKQRVVVTNGHFTATLRSRWGFEKVRSETYLHHAIDAIIVACTDQRLIQRLSHYYKDKESSLSKVEFPLPWDGFRDEVISRINRYDDQYQEGSLTKIVVKIPRYSVTGEAHEQTIMKFGGFDERSGKVIIHKRVKLADIPFDENGDFPMVGKDTDPATYNAIKNRYLEFGKDVKRAFETELYKPSKSDNKNPIKKVTIIDAKKLSYVRHVNGGVAKNGDLVRVDIFKKNDQYFMVPVYVFDTSLDELPNRIVTSGKGHLQWKVLDEDYIFQFSLYKNDLVRIKTDKIDQLVYFSTIDTDSNRIVCHLVNKPTEKDERVRVTLGSITLLEKFKLDLMGNYVKVRREVRRTFKKK